MDKKFLKENNLLEAHKQFMRLCEWSYTPTAIEEDDDQEQQDMANNDPNAMGGNGMPPTDGGMNGGADPNAMGGADPNAMGGDGMPPMDAGMNGGAQDANQDAMGGDGMPPTDGGMNGGADPNAMGGDGMPPMGDMPPMEDEEVIDVDDITNAQEKMNNKVNHVGRELGDVDDKIETLLTSLEKMQQMIDNNNQEIAQFKKEFEKRNPTQTEKLNLRSLDSYPFNVNPKDYWDEKGIDPNSNYSGYADNDEPTDKEYIITNSDVDDFDERAISQSFNIDDELNQDIKKIFGL